MRVNLGTISFRWRIAFAAVFIIILSLVLWLALSPKPNFNSIVTKVNPNEEAAKQTKQAVNSLKNNDYQTAVVSYVLAAADESGAGDYRAAKASLEECIAKVPDANVPYYVYDRLANVAHALGDKTLEKDSLQKALAKGQLPSSEAGSEVLNSYKQRLAELAKQ